jgi:hypothetical protein
MFNGSAPLFNNKIKQEYITEKDRFLFRKKFWIQNKQVENLSPFWGYNKILHKI